MSEEPPAPKTRPPGSQALASDKLEDCTHADTTNTETMSTDTERRMRTNGSPGSHQWLVPHNSKDQKWVCLKGVPKSFNEGQSTVQYSAASACTVVLVHCALFCSVQGVVLALSIGAFRSCVAGCFWQREGSGGWSTRVV